MRSIHQNSFRFQNRLSALSAACDEGREVRRWLCPSNLRSGRQALLRASQMGITELKELEDGGVRLLTEIPKCSKL
jgi:hypothetical protein